MAEYPSTVAEFVGKAVSKYPDDIDRAVEFVKGRVALLPEYPELIDSFFTDAMRALVQDKRHNMNVAINRAAGAYAKPTDRKDTSALNVAALAASSYFNYFIGSRTLGSLTGVELEPLAESEHEKGIGSFRNETILRAVMAIAKAPDKTVRQQVSDKQLEAIFLRVNSPEGGVKTNRFLNGKSANGRAIEQLKPIQSAPGRKTKATARALAGD